MDAATLQRIKQEAAENPAPRNMEAQIKTFIGNAVITLTPAAPAQIPTWSIQNPNRKFFLKSIFWSLRIQDTTNLQYVPYEMSQMVSFQLRCAQLAGINLVLGYDFTPAVAPNPSLANRQLIIDRPGQYFYQDILFQNDLLFYASFVSLDVANTYVIDYNLTVEIKE